MIYVSIVCDHCNDKIQGSAFEADNETCADMKAAWRALGWKFEEKEGTADIEAKCPQCVAAEK